MCREPASFPLGGLREIARSITGGAMGTVTRKDAPGATVLIPITRAAGHGGGCRREPKAFRTFEDEVAGVLLGAAVLAEAAGVDIDAAIARKLTAVQAHGQHGTYSRDWDGDQS